MPKFNLTALIVDSRIGWTMGIGFFNGLSAFLSLSPPVPPILSLSLFTVSRIAIQLVNRVNQRDTAQAV